MTKEEARQIVAERKASADRFIGSTLNFGQNTVLMAMALRESAEWLLSVMDGTTPWSD